MSGGVKVQLACRLWCQHAGLEVCKRWGRTVLTSQTDGELDDCLYPVTCTVQACAGPALPCSAEASLQPK